MSPTIPLSALSTETTTTLPPWTLPEATSGRGSYWRPLPDEVTTALRAGDEESLQSRLVSCWLAVLSRCSGRPDVSTAVIDQNGETYLIAGVVDDVSWSTFAESSDSSPLPAGAETAVDLSGKAAAGAIEVPLSIALSADLSQLEIRYQTDRVSHVAGERVAGYMVHALRAAVDNWSEPIDMSDMVDAEERRYQLESLCGPLVNNGPDGFITGFRSRAAVQPDAVAVRHREEVLTYGELNELSDRVAANLSRSGVESGHPVAVVSDRHPRWIVAMIGVLKARAVYLPVRPDFPPARVADQLTRAGCTIAMADVAGADLMSAALDSDEWQGAVVLIDDFLSEPDGEIELATPDLLDEAYIYFTSGSTGKPKGAVCEHGGMINHLWTKVDDHNLGPDDVVTQTASQCFDISLWQICAPLLVGGETVIVDIDEQLDIAAFAKLLREHRVTTVQIVPSYLEVLLAHLEAGAVTLPKLKSFSVTGEALKADLVRRWFSVVPDVRLVNAYGATEVSDDTMHEVLDGPPRRDLAVVNVGRPLRNMRVYVVDAQHRLMPIGAPGEIVFAGVSVGSGYINDEQRTSEAFFDDPFFPGERLYRSGDLGRWLPEGRLEFLGRRDEQVKIRGLRVEIGEVQAALRRIPGVSDAAVISLGEGNSARLVGFYVSEEELTALDLHDLLSARLPEYMVPASNYRLSEFPLNENGKTDKQRLKQMADELSGSAHAFEPPESGPEQQLASAWAEVLGVTDGRVGRQDNFFDLGGTSLSAIHLLMRLNNRLSMNDVLTEPVLADQAKLLEQSTSDSDVRLLHDLNPEVDAGPVLVCLPDAGGSALNFKRLAEQAETAFRVVGVELPGHDLTRPTGELIGFDRLSEILARELATRPVPEALYIWGQGAGAAAALTLCEALNRVEMEVSGLVLAWDEDSPQPGAADTVGALDDEQVLARLRRRQAYLEVSGASEERSAFVAKAYRHDWIEACAAFDSLGEVTTPIVELTSNSATSRIEQPGPQHTQHQVSADGDLARHHGEQVLAALNQLAKLEAAGL